MTDFESIFCPKSVAVIGASNTVGTVGFAVMENIMATGFRGRIFPINPKSTHFAGLKSYVSIEAVDESIDTAIIMVPAVVVPQIITVLGQKGVKSAVIISAGFKESGASGAELELEVGRLAKHFGVTLLGPNCIGVANPKHHYNATFAASGAIIGGLSLVSQSGALGTALLDLAGQMNIGLAKFATIGNRANLDELELIQYLSEDPETKAIALYLESLTPHDNWVSALSRVSSGHNAKPVILLKGGVTSSGARAALSHTGSVAGDEAVYQTFARQSGCIAVSSLELLMQTAQSLLYNPAVLVGGIAIVTNAGGLGILASDQVEKLRIGLFKPSAEISSKLRQVLPPASSVQNPIDLLGDADAERFGKCLTILAEAPSLSGVVAILTPQKMTDSLAIADQLIKFRRANPRIDISVCLAGGRSFDAARKLLDDAKIAHTIYPESAVDMQAGVQTFARAQMQKPARYQSVPADVSAADRGIVGALHRGQTVLTPDEAQQLLSAYSIPIARGRLAHSAVEAAKIAHAISGAVVLKIVSPDILHKSDFGGVKLSVTPKSASQGYRDIITAVKRAMPAARISGVLVQKMSEHGMELIVGAKRDPVFGPLVMVGLGGIYVESLHDVAMRLAPVSPDAVEAMISELKSANILRGDRGQVGVDIPAVIDCVIKVAEIIINHPEISEMDLNPLAVYAPGQGLEVLDARIVL